MAKNDIFDKSLLLKFIGRDFQKRMGNMTQKELSIKVSNEKTKITQSSINGILNGSVPVSRDKLEHIAKIGFGMKDYEFKDLIVQAKIYEIESTSGKELSTNSIEEVIAKEFDINNPEDVKKIIDVIEMMTKD